MAGDRTFSDVISVTEDNTALSICGSPPILGLIKLLCFSLEEKYEIAGILLSMSFCFTDNKFTSHFSVPCLS